MLPTSSTAQAFRLAERPHTPSRVAVAAARSQRDERLGLVAQNEPVTVRLRQTVSRLPRPLADRARTLTGSCR